jgi:hypothetical protein
MLSKSEVPKEVLAQVRSSLSFAFGVPAIDDGIALGYLKVRRQARVVCYLTLRGWRSFTLTHSYQPVTGLKVTGFA